MPEARAGQVVDIILVHGLFIGAWAWQRVRERLSHEFTVHAPELPFRSLETDADLVRQLVSASTRSGRRVLLVGHSYGGMVISRAGHDASHLCFLGALAPEPGQTTADVAGACVSAMCQTAMVPSPDGTTISLDPAGSIEAWYHLCSAPDIDFAVARHRPAPAAIFAEAVTNPAWLERPSTYIVCAEDRAVDPAYQRGCGQRMGSMATVPADHSAFLSATDALCAVIAERARSLTA